MHLLAVPGMVTSPPEQKCVVDSVRVFTLAVVAEDEKHQSDDTKMRFGAMVRVRATAP